MQIQLPSDSVYIYIYMFDMIINKAITHTFKLQDI